MKYDERREKKKLMKGDCEGKWNSKGKFRRVFSIEGKEIEIVVSVGLRKMIKDEWRGEKGNERYGRGKGRDGSWGRWKEEMFM